MLTYETVQSVRELVRDAAKVYGDLDYIRYVEDGEIRSISFEEFNKEMLAVATWVQEKSNELGHPVRVALLAKNSVLYLKMLVGIMCGGGVAVPIDAQMNKESLCGCMNKAEIDVLIYNREINLDEEYIKGNSSFISEVWYLEEGEAPACESIIEDYEGREPNNVVKAEDCALILFTSGTTGEEKGVMLSNCNLVDSVFNTNHPKHSVKLNVLPFNHAFCINADILINLAIGSTICLNGDMSKLGENLQLFEPTMLNMVPMVAQALYTKLEMLSTKEGKTLKECKSKVFGRNMQKIVAGGAHLPSELVDKYQDLGIFLCQGYGMTECAPTIASPDTTRRDKASSAGRVVKRCKTRVVDGELQVKSPSVMMGYVNAPELTRQVLTEDGWLCTGDIGYEDEEGFLHITGRKKNLIILANGENVSPEQIENLLTDHQIVEECLVYGDGNSIVGEVYPNMQYAKMKGHDDIHIAIDDIVQSINSKLPSYKKITKQVLRKVPFRRTSARKIIRNQRATHSEILRKEGSSMRMPEGEIQNTLYDILSQIIGNKDFGVDTDLFLAGLDSLGCIMALSQFSEEMNFNIQLDDLMKNATIEKIEKLYTKKESEENVDYTSRPIYPLTKVQMFFAYVMRGNTTSNIPFLFDLDERVDVPRLKKAIEGLFDVHPILRNVIQMFEEKGLANFRDDKREVNIPVIKLSKKEWEEKINNLIQPYMYGPGEPLYHIEIYEVGNKKYLFFDVAHVISDGVTLGIMLNNLNALYNGEKIEKETYSFYEYILDEKHREENGLRTPNEKYFKELMDGMKIDRTILNRPNPKPEELNKGENAAIYGLFNSIDRNKVEEFCNRLGISKNALFISAFNYCISLFSNKSDTISTSIHNGRTDSRWAKLAGCLFVTYNFRCKFNEEDAVEDVLKNSAKQIIETMCCHVNNLHADEMFIQYQGELITGLKLCGENTKSVRLQLDSLPFHLMVHESEKGFTYELRYWNNRFDEAEVKNFMEVLDYVIQGMVSQDSLAYIRQNLPKHLISKEISVDSKELNDKLNVKLAKGKVAKVAIKDRVGNHQIIGAWGYLSINGEVSDIECRILCDGTLDLLEASGRHVMIEGLAGRSYPNLHKIEELLLNHSSVNKAHVYVSYCENNQLLLTADIESDSTFDEVEFTDYIHDKCDEYLTTSKFIINNEQDVD